MANYTQAQAEACTVRRCESVTEGGTHKQYCFAVEDDNGFEHKWCDTTLAAGSTAAQIESAIVTYLQGVDKPAAPAAVVVTPDNAVIGDTVGNISA